MAVNPKPFRRKEKRWLYQYKTISRYADTKIRMKLSETGERKIRKSRHLRTMTTFGLAFGKPHHYVLKKRKPIPVDFMMWAMWFEDGRNRIVKQTTLPGGERVSTVFLGLDHSYSGDVPLLFETMIFNGEYNLYQARYATWEEAEAGHEKAIHLIFEVD